MRHVRKLAVAVAALAVAAGSAAAQPPGTQGQPRGHMAPGMMGWNGRGSPMCGTMMTSHIEDRLASS
jgi:hypothetical protein